MSNTDPNSNSDSDWNAVHRRCLSDSHSHSNESAASSDQSRSAKFL